MERQTTQGKLHKSEKKKHGKKKTKNTNSGQNHKEKAPRKAAHILREKEKKRSAIYVGNPSCERLGGEFLGCWKCWKCWECWKIYDFSTLSMFSMLSMLQKEGNAAQESPFIANAVRTKHSAGERTSSTREKQHGRGDSTVQGERTSSTRVKQHGMGDSTAQGEHTNSTREKQHGRGDSTVQKSAQAPQDGKNDSSGKQKRGRQALRCCGFGGRCSENL